MKALSARLVCLLFIFALPQPEPALSAEPQRYTREEFEKLLIGKTKEEIVKILGKPDTVLSSTPNDDTWQYKRLKVYDGQTDATFGRVVILFSNNRYRHYSLSVE